jgi:ADP-ribosylglycohydrolase
MNDIRNALLGVITGDALGVPVEFTPREELRKNPVKGMRGYGTYNQPPGTWSDDSSLTLCLAEALTSPFDMTRIARSFVDWLYHNRWTPHGEVFDVGNTTGAALRNLKEGATPERSGLTGSASNGNGALMRIMPLLFEVKDLDDAMDRYQVIGKVAAITHGHIRSRLSCFYYLEYARSLLQGDQPREAYHQSNQNLLELMDKLNIDASEASHFNRLTGGNIDQLEDSDIGSGTYVVHTLEAATWCILNTQNYQESVLKAVNLGEDTDTTAAVTGGLSGLIYTADGIPAEWIQSLARLDDIEHVIAKLNKKYEQDI